jgi:hypothetical protein
MGGDSNRGSSNLSLKTTNPDVERLKQEVESSKRYNYISYLLRDKDLRDILCFEHSIPKNVLVFRLAKLFRNLNTAEILVFRLVELKLYSEYIFDSYPTVECREVCVEKKGRKCVKKEERCEQVTKNIFGLMPAEELTKVCSQSYI